MMNAEPSSTYKKLYSEIIAPLFSQICMSNINYCVRKEINGISAYAAISNKFEEYRSKAVKKMQGGRLDRHKLASCICGAIVEVKPLVGYNGATILKKANEIFALFVGINVIKMYMIYDLVEGLQVAPDKEGEIKDFLRDNFQMNFPNNIRDTQEYRINLENALYWIRSECDIARVTCYKYDIWAYSNIFFHLEHYNQLLLRQSYEGYEKT